MDLSLLMRLGGKSPTRKRRKGRATRPSHAAEAAYRADLLELVGAIRKAVDEYLLPELKRYEPQYARTPTSKDSLDVRDGFALDVMAVFDQMAERFGGIDRVAARLARMAVARQAEQTDRQLSLSLANALDISVDVTSSIRALSAGPAVEAATIANANLIKSLPTQFLEKSRQLTLNGVTSGRRYEDVAADIQKQLNATASRAKLIARDQMAKVNAAITEAKQSALGIEEYEWVTAGDERVRPSHRANNGKIFRWDDPPSATGHPGTDVACRCTARPIIKIEE